MREMDQTARKFRSPKELAGEVGLAYSTVIAFLQDGAIRGVRFGSAWRIPTDEYDRVLREGVQPKGPRA